MKSNEVLQHILIQHGAVEDLLPRMATVMSPFEAVHQGTMGIRHIPDWNKKPTDDVTSLDVAIRVLGIRFKDRVFESAQGKHYLHFITDPGKWAVISVLEPGRGGQDHDQGYAVAEIATNDKRFYDKFVNADTWK